MSMIGIEEVDADERRVAALSRALRLYAEAGRRSERADSDQDRAAAEQEAEALGDLVRAAVAAE